MSDQSSIRINRSTGEVEITGSEGFIREHVEKLSSVIGIDSTKPDMVAPEPAAPATAPVQGTAEVPVAEPAPIPAPVVKAEAPKKAEVPADKPAPKKRGRKPGSKNAPKVMPKGPVNIKLPATFKQFFKQFPAKVKKGDLILAAGFFAQSNNKEKQFSTYNASKLLKMEGITLTNPSQYVKNNIAAKRLTQLNKGRYRVSELGQQYIAQLMKKA